MIETQPVSPRSEFRLERSVGILVLLLLLVGSLMVMLPFLMALAWAFVLAFSLWPVNRWLVTRLRGRRTLAAMIMTSAIALVLVIPVVLLVAHFAEDAQEIGHATRNWLAAGPPSPPKWLEKVPLVGSPLSNYWQNLANDAARFLDPDPPTTREALGQTALGQAIKKLLALGGEWVPAIGSAIIYGLVQVALSVLLTFFIFQNGEGLATRLNVAADRIAGEKALRLIEVGGSTVRGVVYGILGTALVQGVMAGIGFLIAGVPGAVLLGFVTFVVSAIPVGPPLVWIPASLWLFHTGQVGWGIFMLIWGLGVSTVDNVVKPLIISRGSSTPFILILFGVIGGALAFGFIGVFLGPTLLAVAYRLIEDWSRAHPPATSPTTLP